MVAVRGHHFAILFASSCVGASAWIRPVGRGPSYTPSVRFEYRYSTHVPECDNRCGAGNGTAVPVCSQFRTDLLLNGKPVFVRHLANLRPCSSRGRPSKPKDEQCWGTSPVGDFCTSCGESRCDKCAPGFKLVEGHCKNDERQVLVDITSPGHLYHEWQQQYQPQLERCLHDAVRDFGVKGADYTVPTIHVANVLDIEGVRQNRDNILIRSAVRVPLGISANALAGWLRTEASFLMTRDRCPVFTSVENVTILCPGAVLAHPDSVCPTGLKSFRLPLVYWDCVGISAIVLAVIVFICLERRRRKRDLNFTDSATKQARRIAHSVEAQMRDF